MKRGPRLLLVAVALSLLLHVVVALILRPPSPTSANQAEVVSIEHRPASIAVRRVPPPPPPRPTPAPRAPGSAPPARKGPGPGVASGNAAPSTPVVARVTPQPTPSAGGACTAPNADAAVLSTPPPPDIATEARASGTSGLTVVSVQLDSGGQITNTSVTQSSGNTSLDLVAISMARDARYSPALRDCKPVASAYAFSVKFVAW
jgi:protein TonB